MSDIPQPPPCTHNSGNKLLVWLGPPFFSTRLSASGWEVVWAEHDLSQVRDWEIILQLTGGKAPGVVVVADGSTPPLVSGIETFPCLTVFYSVDSHIHGWHPFYAQGFDLCLISLGDHLPLFQKGRLDASHVWWTPAYARDEDRPPAVPPEVEWDVLFVGTVDPDLTPERHAFINELRNMLPGLHVTRGRFFDLYPKAKLILNECSQGDLNFRVFEALGCGGCLLTPAIGHGLTDLFTPGRDLFTYPQHDVAALLPLIRRLLEDAPLRRQTAENGLAAVDTAHRASHRAEAFVQNIGRGMASGDFSRMIAERTAMAAAIHSWFLKPIYLHYAENIDIITLKQQYLRAARRTPPPASRHLP